MAAFNNDQGIGYSGVPGSQGRVTQYQKADSNAVLGTAIKGVIATADSLWSGWDNNRYAKEAEAANRVGMDTYSQPGTQPAAPAQYGPPTPIEGPMPDGTTVDAANKGGSLFSSPAPIKEALPPELVGVQAAMQQGRMSRTAAYQRMDVHIRNRLAQDPTLNPAKLRDTYEKMFGVNPGKAYIESVQEEQKNQRERAEKLEDRWTSQASEASKAGIPAEFINEATRDPSKRQQVLSEMYSRNAGMANVEREKAQIGLAKSRGEDVSRRATDLGNNELDIELNRFLDNTSMVSGKDPSSPFNTINRLMSRGPQALSANEQAELAQAGRQIDLYKQQVLQKVLYSPRDIGGEKRTLASLMPDKAAIENITARAEARVNFWKEAIQNKDYGLLNHNKNILEAQKNGAMSNAMSDEHLARLYAAQQIVGPTGLTMILGQPAGLSALNGSLQRLIAAKVPIDTISGDSVTQAIGAAKRQGADSKTLNFSLDQSLKNFTDKSVPPEVSKRAFESWFGQGNVGMLRGEGGSRGQGVKFDDKTRAMIFDKATSPVVQLRVQELAKEDPSVLTKYEAWVQDSSLVLMRESVDTLKTHVATPDDRMRITYDGQKFGYSLNKDRFTQLQDGALLDSRVPQRGEGGALTIAEERLQKDIVPRLNATIETVRRTAQTVGKDPDQAVQQMFAGMGISGEIKTKLDEALVGFNAMKPTDKVGGKPASGVNSETPAPTQANDTVVVEAPKVATPPEQKAKPFAPGTATTPPSGLQTLDDGTQIEWSQSNGKTTRRVKTPDGEWGQPQEVALQQGKGMAAPRVAQPVPSTRVAAPTTPTGGTDTTSLRQAIFGAESSGNPNAKNPNSSATGLGQFIEGTWMEGVKETNPPWAQGKSKAEILAMRKDPDASVQMTDWYINKNVDALVKAGHRVTPGHVYLMHFAGTGGGIKVLNSDPSTPIEKVLDAGAIAANPFLKGKNVEETIRWAFNTIAKRGNLTRSATDIGQEVRRNPNEKLRARVADLPTSANVEDRRGETFSATNWASAPPIEAGRFQGALTQAAGDLVDEGMKNVRLESSEQQRRSVAMSLIEESTQSRKGRSRVPSRTKN
jgi:hypothetical protein